MLLTNALPTDRRDQIEMASRSIAAHIPHSTCFKMSSQDGQRFKYIGQGQSAA